ncbi:uncharacterized protein ALTATR162_LOCUS5088 [Alternaria atra]|uniref:Berberine/berberine-like domain-containing protein n=1 Tax=Alternaria atra TaxID=119953 RepID=A0A8J2MZM9_9PLEO|nr:uncharacterized protein ALTATR162_LOCUS5088 [Alternaria atra]CAG5158455.1 unnamed protein product [Alternaria atra]
MLARSFGLLGDYIVSLDIVDAEGDAYTITKQSHPDLFYGFLGGSPGNFGVITHFKVELQEDVKHKGSKGLWMAFQYSEETLKYLLDILIEKSEDANFPRGYDFGVNVLSRNINLLDVFPGSEDELRETLPDWVMHKVTTLTNFKLAPIVVYVQWVNLPGEPVFDPSLFDRIREAPGSRIIEKNSGDDWGMSQIMRLWLFNGDREFGHPYVKRTNTTNSTTLSEDGFSSWFTSRVEELVEDRKNGLYISSQLQVMGGKNSMCTKHAGNGTAYSWRDTTLCGTWDAFYDEKVTTKQKAVDWQKENDDGAKAHFAKQKHERRLLWGSYGDWNMKDESVWRCYYEEESYRKLQKIKKQVDPKGVFTANPFCVEAAE